MMGVYFAATGLGNKLAGSIGEASQEEPIKIELASAKDQTMSFLGAADTLLLQDKDIVIRTNAFPTENGFDLLDFTSGKSALGLVKFDDEGKAKVIQTLKENNATKDNPYHITLRYSKDFEAKKIKANKGDGKNYKGKLIIEEIQSKRESRTFLGIFILTLVFGLLVIAMLKPLKRLTHGAEDDEHEMAH